MKIAEMFYSIQGEGMLAGVPSVFIRTSGCNLRCRWCDTPYAAWEGEGEELGLEAILGFVGAHACAYVVVTGGEPMIARGIVPLTKRLRRMGRHVTVETAGTVFAPVACNLMSISPKLSNSTPTGPGEQRRVARHERLRLQPAVLRRLMDAYEYQLKFVVTEPGDLGEIRTLIRELKADPRRVLLMAEGTEASQLRERGRWLVELCKQEGFGYSPRLQIELYGHRRGV